ncbi:MAG: LysR family transcriptional regulator [Oscillospiraceae bacterium]|nr:LysR family transcriptional regulator [Oscillospiraceae bacterium]
MLTETSIRCFLSLANTLNFTSTAKELYMSQQAVSQHISRLEEDLGFPLFIRTRRSVALTNGGKTMQEFWSKEMREYSLLKQLCQSRYASHCGSLRVGYQNWMNFGTAINTALNRLEKAYPESVVETLRGSPSVLLQRLEERDLNVVLIYARFVQDISKFKMMELKSVPIMLMISATHPKVKKDATYEDFITEPFISDVFPGEPSAEALLRAKKEAAMYGLKPSKIIMCEGREAAYTEAELGRGYVLSTGFSRMYQSEELEKYPIGQDEHIVCLWNEGEDNPLAEEYAEMLKQAYWDSANTPKHHLT